MSQLNSIGTHRTSVFTDEGYTKVVYHKTIVVKFNHREIILNSGQWFTSTTKARMNQASNQFDLGYLVYQRDYDWYVRYSNRTYKFTDNMVIDRLNQTIDKIPLCNWCNEIATENLNTYYDICCMKHYKKYFT